MLDGHKCIQMWRSVYPDLPLDRKVRLGEVESRQQHVHHIKTNSKGMANSHLNVHHDT